MSNPKPDLQDLILPSKSPKKVRPLSSKSDMGKAKDVIDALEQTMSKDQKTRQDSRLEVKLAEHKKQEKPKVDLFKVVLASAAAEVVNLKSKGKVLLINTPCIVVKLSKV